MQVNVTLDIPKEIYNRYNESADNKDLAAVMSERLVACADHTAVRPLYLNDYQRQRVEKLLGYNIFSAEQLVKLVEQVVTIKVGDTKIPLGAVLLGRLKSRCFDKRSFQQFVHDQVVHDLEVYTGLR